MKKFSCPVCEFEIELSDKTGEKVRVTCPGCSAQLGLFKQGDKFILGCALCKEPVFDPSNCEECERRREKHKLIEEGRI